MAYPTWHWRIVSVMRRCFGLMACAAGTVFLLGPLLQRLGWMDGLLMSGSDYTPFALVGVVALGVGIYTCRKPSFRPDLGDQAWWSDHTGGPIPQAPSERSARGWWTGNLK
jgi:hypothetical protein